MNTSWISWSEYRRLATSKTIQVSDFDNFKLPLQKRRISILQSKIIMYKTSINQGNQGPRKHILVHPQPRSLLKSTTTPLWDSSFEYLLLPQLGFRIINLESVSKKGKNIYSKQRAKKRDDNARVATRKHNTGFCSEVDLSKFRIKPSLKIFCNAKQQQKENLNEVSLNHSPQQRQQSKQTALQEAADARGQQREKQAALGCSKPRLKKISQINPWDIGLNQQSSFSSLLDPLPQIIQ